MAGFEPAAFPPEAGRDNWATLDLIFKFQIFKISFSTSLFGLTNIKWINSKPVEREKITTETANFFKYAKFGKIHPEVWGHKALRTLIVYTQLKS